MTTVDIGQVTALPTHQVVPFFRPDLPRFDDIADRLRSAFETDAGNAPATYVEQFEQAVSSYLGTYVVSVSSATLGLLFTLQAFGLKPGQRVIVPSFTSIATAQAIRYASGVPTFAEIHEDLTLSTADLEMLLARHDDVAAVVPVHMHGLPCRVDEIQQVVDAAARRSRRAISVIYDAAHAFGSSSNGRAVGTFGNAEVFSLSGSKVLVSGEGGLISGHHIGLTQRLRKMRNNGIDAGYRAYWPGLSSRMSELHAIVGLANLARLPERMAERQRRAHAYGSLVERETSFRVAAWPTTTIHTFKDFTILVPPELKDRRDRIVEILAERGVEARACYYPPIHQQPHFRMYVDRPLPRTEDLSQRIIALPFFTAMSASDVEYVVTALSHAERTVSQGRPAH
jgi:dTDP-4-amino-4,6-dideoxygalactose transaminase